MLTHAVDYGLRPVDFPALRARVHISGPVGPVDYGLRICGLRMLAHAVDYGLRPVDYASLWISGLEE